MRARVVPPLVVLVLAFVTARPSLAVDSIAAQERLGARIGHVDTFDEVNKYYGSGWEVTLLFNEHLFSRLFLDLHVGALYLGDLLDPELDDFITKTDNIESEMRMFYFSLGVVYGFPLGSSAYTLTTSAAAGIYSVSVALAADFFADDLSDQYFGGNAGIGLVRRLGTSWSLELNCTAHYFDNGANNADLLWVFTAGGATDPLLIDTSLGVVVDLR